MELKTYYDFALDDYQFLIELKKNGITANSIGAIAQNTCERFLKHLMNTSPCMKAIDKASLIF